MDALYCLFCHEKNKLTVTHCVNCGASLIPEEAASALLPPDDGVLLFDAASCEETLRQLPPHSLALFAPDQAEPIILPKVDRVVLGRSDLATSVKVLDLSQFGEAASSTSRRHAMLSLTANGFTVSDLGSTNGTWLNQRPLQPGKLYKLKSQDQIRLGSLTMLVCFESQPTAVQPVKMLLRRRNTLVRGEHLLRPHFLLTHLSPYLQAINEMQQILNRDQDKAPEDLHIHKIIEEDGGVTVFLNMERNTFHIIRDQIRPWRDEYTEYTSLTQQLPDDALQHSINHLAVHILTDVMPGRSTSKAVVKRFQDVLLILATSKLEPFIMIDEGSPPPPG